MLSKIKNYYNNIIFLITYCNRKQRFLYLCGSNNIKEIIKLLKNDITLLEYKDKNNRNGFYYAKLFNSKDIMLLLKKLYVK